MSQCAVMHLHVISRSCDARRAVTVLAASCELTLRRIITLTHETQYRKQSCVRELRSHMFFQHVVQAICPSIARIRLLRCMHDVPIDLNLCVRYTRIIHAYFYLGCNIQERKNHFPVSFLLICYKSKVHACKGMNVPLFFIKRVNISVYNAFKKPYVYCSLNDTHIRNFSSSVPCTWR